MTDRASSLQLQSPTSTGFYQGVDVDPNLNAVQAVENLLKSCQRHATLIWVVLPLFTCATWFVELLRPTCETGYANWTLLGLLLLVAHHLHAESQAWAASKQLLARPEISVMQQLGVLRKRQRLVVLGILEDLDIYSNLTFPFVAHSCDITLTTVWLESWFQVPLIGKAVKAVLVHVRFWGFSAILVSLVCFVGIGGLLWQVWSGQTLVETARAGGQTPRSATARSRNLAAQGLQKEGSRGSGASSRTSAGGPTLQLPRLGGDEFLELARAAENAAMPSVAELCEEMAQQRRWVFDYDKNESNGGAAGLLKMRRDAVFGKADRQAVEKAEMFDQEERESLEWHEKLYFLVLLLGKVLLGNSLQLWLQASFFGLAFEDLGPQASTKLVIGMAIGALQILVRCKWACTRLGCWGSPFVFLNLALVVWSGAKVFYAFKCKEHVWNLTTQCLDMPGNHTL